MIILKSLSFKLAIGILIIFLAIALIVPNEKSYFEKTISFVHGNDKLIGILTTPESEGAYPCIIFVHGDSAMPSDAFGFYRPFWEQLAKKGIASFSWDKAGVGGSSGDWENQSMDDRADEVVAAIEMLKKRDDIIPNKIGLIGFSQAGWVLPLVASKSDFPDIMVLVSGAINWMDQGAYITQTRLTREGHSQARIKEAIDDHYAGSAKLLSPASTYDDFLQSKRRNAKKFWNNKSRPVSAQRFQFIKKNWRYDARDNLKDIDCPTLATFGDKDLNVNAAESSRIYQEEFTKSGNMELTIKTFPGAQHSLLKHRFFPEIHPGIWFMIKFEILGDYAFAEGYLDYVTGWIEGRL